MRVVICGAGVIGASIAHYLAELGIGATLVERAEVAAAASGKSGGFLALDWCDGSPLEGLARPSFELHARLATTLPAITGHDHGYRRMRTFAAAASARRSFSEYVSTHKCSWIDGDCVVHQALGQDATTAQIHPRLFTEGLVHSARARGARLLIGRVEGIETDAASGRVVAVVVDGERLEADAVVIAMGPWSLLAAEWLPLPAVHGLKGYSITLRPRRPVAAEAVFLDYETQAGERIGPEIFPRPDGEVYLCGMSDDSPLPLAPEDIHVDEAACRSLASIAAQIGSELADAELTGMQACYRPICQDALPLLGAVDGVEGAFVATGHNCWGMLNAPASGLAMAELIVHGRSREIDLGPFNPGRLPPARRTPAKATAAPSGAARVR